MFAAIQARTCRCQSNARFTEFTHCSSSAINSLLDRRTINKTGERPSFNFEFEKENQVEQCDSAWGVSTLTTWSRSGLIWQSDQCLLSSFSSSIRSWRLLGWSGSTAKVIIAGDVLWTTQTPLLNISAQYLTVYIHYLQCTCACLAAHSYARTCACTCTCM